MTKVIKLFIFVFIFFAIFSSSASAYVCPDYFFGKDLAKGDSDEDVKVIQEILNLDKRTVIAYSGPGSKGRETGYFGVATRESLKRFQALFIEYIGVANGKFGPKTRTTMNAVCKGPFFAGTGEKVFETPTAPKDTTPPVVAVAAPYSTEISQSFRAYIGSNEAIKTPTLNNLIIFNATAGDIRKVSSTTYSFSVIPNQDAKGDITLQFEADAIEDLAGNKNENATNEWPVKIVGVSPTTTATVTPPIFEIPDIDLPVITPTVNNCADVKSVSVSDYTNPCYGKVPTDFGNQAQDSGGGGGGGGGGIGEMLQGLLKGLMSALGGGAGAGGGQPTDGSVGPRSACACAAALTTQFYAPLSGGFGPGGYVNVGVSGGGAHYVGRAGPPPGICGTKVVPPPSPTCDVNCRCAGEPGKHIPTCCGINFDMSRQPVMGTLAPSPTGMNSN